MAKRYASFELIPEGYFKPEGTMGSHHCRVVIQGDKKIVIGSVSGKVTLKHGDTLGYDLGTVWLVPSAESYRDPIRKILAQAHMSQKVLIYSDDPVEYMFSWEDPTFSEHSYDTSEGEEAVILGNFEKDTESKPWSFCEKTRVRGGDVIIIKEVIGRDQTNIRPRHIIRVVVRPSIAKEEVAQFLSEEFSLQVPNPMWEKRDFLGKKLTRDRY